MFSYFDAINYLNSIPWTTRKPGLHRMKELMERLGNPQDALKFIHIAGTNGKGSTSAMLASVLREAGYKAGLFTSPHLLRVNERMRIDGEEICDDEFAGIVSLVAGVAKKMQEEPSEFEVLTAAGFMWFKQKQCDIVVLEVGLGGEFDSTNIIKTKEVAVITPIGYDHTAILGDNIEDIAKAKAGIITDSCDVVLAVQKGFSEHENFCTKLTDSYRIEKVVTEKAFEKNARLHIPDYDSIQLVSSSIEGQVFTSSYSILPIRLNLIGAYQLQNVATVLETIMVLNSNGSGFKIDENAVCAGLSKVEWAARFEVIHKNPVFILDGAHNDHGVRAAVRSLKDIFGEKKIIYILGILSDKNIDEMLKELCSNAKCFITLTPESSRALAGEKLAERLRSSGFDAISFNEPEEAVKYSFRLCRDDDVICSIGSLYLAGHVRECIKSF